MGASSSLIHHYDIFVCTYNIQQEKTLEVLTLSISRGMTHLFYFSEICPTRSQGFNQFMDNGSLSVRYFRCSRSPNSMFTYHNWISWFYKIHQCRLHPSMSRPTDGIGQAVICLKQILKPLTDVSQNLKASMIQILPKKKKMYT